MRIGRFAATATAMALALAGCSGDDGDDAPAGDTPEATSTAAPGTEDDDAADDGGGTAEGPTVTVSGISFQDASVTVEAGTTVSWVNEDDVPHTVTSGTPDDATGVFDEDLPAGGEATVTVDEPGTYAYFCEIHPNMTAELVVEPSGG